ncbi:hypothetical protein GIB67_003825 [Kingdonia uniflora]|uniref:Uncharacterized protein n=1 Tax=Kingdonia uniflora TaxID=39325 RepID=A0A7J7P3V4_9MAGN|nr:hypothetical protein GIB67_003825 [Kingdonia uniflora]
MTKRPPTKNQKIEDNKKGKEEWQKKKNANKKNKKAEEADVPLKKKVEGTKKEAFTDEQFDHVPLIPLKTLIPKIPKKGLAIRQVAHGEGLEVVKDLVVDDDVEVGMEVNFKAIMYVYGGDLLEKKGDKKDDDEKKDVEEKVKYDEEQPQVAEEEDSKLPTIVVYYNGKKDVQHANEVQTMGVAKVQTMGVAEVAKTNIIFFNQEEVVGEAYQTMEAKKTQDEASLASADQTTVVSIEEQTIEVAHTEIVISHQEEDVDDASQSKEEVEQNKGEVVEGKDDHDGNLKIN